jgi:hypothetical protein
MQFSPTSRHFLSLRSKHPPQHPVLKHPQPMFFNLRTHTEAAKLFIFVAHLATFSAVRSYWMENREGFGKKWSSHNRTIREFLLEGLMKRTNNPG